MQRPVVLTVFGILNLIFGGLGAVGTLFSAMMFLAPQNPDIPNPALELMKENAAYATFTNVAMVLGLAASIVLVVAGIGLLKVKAWGRYLSIGYGVYGIVMAIVGALVNYFWLIAPMMEKMGDLPGGAEKAGLIGGVIGGVFGACFGLIYPVILLVFMFVPSVVAALRPQQTADRFDL